MVTSYAIRGPVSHLTITSMMTPGIYESLNFMVGQAIAAATRQNQATITDLNYAASHKDMTSSTPTIQKSLSQFRSQ